MLKAILWKEWREQRWKLAFGTVMLLFFTGSFLAAQVTSSKETVLNIWGLSGFLLTIYSAMGVFAPEHTNHTKSFLASKPIQPWKTFLCKWFFGWLNFSVPLLVGTLGIMAFGTGNQGIQWYQFPNLYLFTAGIIAFATIYYTLICGLAPRKAGEAGVGLTGLLVLIGVLLYGTLTNTPGFSNPLQYFDPRYFIILSINFTDLGFTKPNLPMFLLAQFILFIFFMAIGYRKWKRSV